VTSITQIQIDMSPPIQGILQQLYKVLAILPFARCDSVTVHFDIVDWDSVVGIATPYGLDGVGIESCWGERDFPHSFRPVLGPTQPPIQWVRGHSRGLGGRVVALTTHPHPAPRLKKE
jgi:hypothetical protein